MSTRFQEGRWRDWYEVNALQLSSYCLARGRYELAHELHAIGTEWYERNVVNNSDPRDTADDREHYREVLAEYKERLAEFPLLVSTRSRFLESLSANAGGIDRDRFKTKVNHEGSTAFGVICNQLARGGWLRQEKTGKKCTLYPAETPPPSDEVFVRKEMPTPEELDAKAASARPIATFNANLPLEKRSGCLPKLAETPGRVGGVSDTGGPRRMRGRGALELSEVHRCSRSHGVHEKARHRSRRSTTPGTRSVDPEGTNRCRMV